MYLFYWYNVNVYLDLLSYLVSIPLFFKVKFIEKKVGRKFAITDEQTHICNIIEFEYLY